MVLSNERLLNAKAVGDRLGIPKSRVYQLTREGEFADFVVEIGRRQYRYKLEGLEEYIERGGRRGAAKVKSDAEVSSEPIPLRIPQSGSEPLGPLSGFSREPESRDVQRPPVLKRRGNE